ncbi:hypothetical protein MTO96_024002 [Rhipicephalus appendiculatus]
MALAPSLPFFPPFNRGTAPVAIGDRWRRWIDRFENLLVALQINNAEQKKALLLHYIGEETYDVYASLSPVVPASSTASSSNDSTADSNQPDEYKQIKKRLPNHFTPKVNREYKIFNFRKSTQQDGETIDDFYTRLRSMARYCSCPDVDLEIKSQIVLGTTSTKLRWFALQTNATLEQLPTQGCTYEVTSRQLKEMQRAAPAEINQVGRRQKHSRSASEHKPRQSASTERERKCFNCGGPWPHERGRSSCPAANKTCQACKKRGHYSAVCRGKSQHRDTAHRWVDQSLDSDDQVSAIQRAMAKLQE